MAPVDPSFSVIVTNYNYHTYVIQAIESILAQHYPAAEILVVDDGSTDGSRELLTERYGQRPNVRLLFKENGGQLSSFIVAASHCSGDILCFLDADDRWTPGYLCRLAIEYSRDPNLDFVYTNVRFVGAREGQWHEYQEDYDSGLSALPTVFMGHPVGSPTSALSMRRALALRVLDLPDSFLLDWRIRADDCLVYGASALGGRKRYLAALLVDYRVHDANNWLGRKEDRTVNLRYRYRVQRLLAHYAAAGGLTRESLKYAGIEFKTKPQPSRADLWRYLRLAAAAPIPWRKRLKRHWSILKHYWRTRPLTQERGRFERHDPLSEISERVVRLLSVPAIVDDIVAGTDLSRSQAEERLAHEQQSLGWNVAKDVQRFGVTPHEYSPAMERLYREGDGFIFETTSFWRQPNRMDWSRRGLQRLQAYAAARDLPPEALRVLMFGDGGGSDTLFLVAAGFRPHYFDVPGSRISKFSRTRIQRHGAADHVTFVEDYAGLAGAQYDAVWCYEVLEHLPDPVATIQHLAAALRYGGIALITESFAVVRPDLPTHLRANLIYAEATDALFRRNGLYLRWLEPREARRPAEYQKLRHSDWLGRFRAWRSARRCLRRLARR